MSFPCQSLGHDPLSPPVGGGGGGGGGGRKLRKVIRVRIEKGMRDKKGNFERGRLSNSVS